VSIKRGLSIFYVFTLQNREIENLILDFTLGWANEECVFNPQKGIGVGDTTNSCGFDGTRCKVWSGPSVDILTENDYGT